MGEVLTHTVTFSEGLAFRDFLQILAQEERLEHTLYDHNINVASGEASDDLSEDYASALAKLGLPIEHHEGWFFPDTYQFILGDSDVSIL